MNKIEILVEDRILTMHEKNLLEAGWDQFKARGELTCEGESLGYKGIPNMIVYNDGFSANLIVNDKVVAVKSYTPWKGITLEDLAQEKRKLLSTPDFSRDEMAEINSRILYMLSKEESKREKSRMPKGRAR